MDCFPVGVRFHPTDEELIGHYLYMKNNPNSVTASTGPSFVPPEFDLYGETEPWIIWEAYGGPRLKHQDLFFFTRLKKANTRINRKIGSSGTWSQGESSKPIFDKKKKNKDKDTPIGRKTKLRYENKLVPEQHGCCYMEEYTTLYAAAQHHYVICRFRENRNRSSSSGAGAIRNYDNKRKYQYDDDDDDHSKPTKNPKSLRVAAPTTNETVSFNQSPDPEELQPFDAVEMFHPHELFGNDDDQMAQPFSQHQVVQVEDDQDNDYFLASLDQWLNTDNPIDNDGQYQFSDSDVEAFLADSSICGLF